MTQSKEYNPSVTDYTDLLALIKLAIFAGCSLNKILLLCHQDNRAQDNKHLQSVYSHLITGFLRDVG